MRVERLTMGMPARVELVGATDSEAVDKIFDLWREIDERFSTYKNESEISRINKKELSESEYSAQMREIFSLAQETNVKTRGYFNITQPDGRIDPSGIVKGWAIQKAAVLAQKLGFDSYYLEIAGDIQTRGLDEQGREWTIGIRNPFNREEIVKVLIPRGAGVATSGSAARGAHIYNPHNPTAALKDVVSITVIGPDIYEADRFATAAFAMGKDGVSFINSLPGMEAYAIDRDGLATMTDGIDSYLVQ